MPSSSTTTSPATPTSPWARPSCSASRCLKTSGRPYSSANIAEFWRKWHITFSQWLRDYVYFSLPSERSFNAAKFINPIITMLLGGLWHGFGWTFVIWGAMHGIALSLTRAWQDWRKRNGAKPSAWGPLRGHLPYLQLCLCRMGLLPRGFCRRRARRFQPHWLHDLRRRSHFARHPALPRRRRPAPCRARRALVRAGPSASTRARPSTCRPPLSSSWCSASRPLPGRARPPFAYSRF